MHLINLKITDEQKRILFELKESNGVPVQAQIRKAIDQHIVKPQEK